MADNDKIEDLLGIKIEDEEDEDGLKLSPMVPVQKAVPAKIEVVETEQDIKDDYGMSRKFVQNLLETQQDLMEKMIEFINSAPSIAAFEAMTKLLKEMGVTSDKLLEVQQKMRKLLAEDKPTPTTPTHINLFGSPTDVLDAYEKGRKPKEPIDVTPE